MALDEKQRAAMLAATKEAATALLEDIDHIESVVSTKTPSRAQVRYLSTTLRRLLVNRELADIAAPRIGRIELLVPDNKPYLKLEKLSPYRFFCSGGAPLFGPIMRPLTVRDTTNFETMKKEQAILSDADWQATVPVRLDGFLSQPVLCTEGSWTNRREVIKFVANTASGAHSAAPKTNDELLLAKLRKIVSVTSDGETVTARIKVGLTAAPVDVSQEFPYRPDAIDVVLYELMSAGHYLLRSPDLGRLKETIKKELGI